MHEPFGARQPLAFGAMAVAAGVVGDACAAAIVALLDVAAERRRPARRDGAHDASLDAAEMPGTDLPKRFAVAAEDIRHLQNRSHGTRSAGRHDLQTKPVKWAWCFADGFGGDLSIERGAGQAGVAE
jgi:hypothetical protein